MALGRSVGVSMGSTRAKKRLHVALSRQIATKLGHMGPYKGYLGI